MAFWCVGGNPLLLLVLAFDSPKVESDLLDVVHVVGEEQDGVPTISENRTVVQAAPEVHVDVVQPGNCITNDQFLFAARRILRDEASVITQSRGK